MMIEYMYLRWALYYLYLHPPRHWFVLLLWSPPILTASRNLLPFNVFYLTAYHITYPQSQTHDALTRYNTDINA